MRIKLLVLTLAILSGFGRVNAQEKHKHENKHEIRISASDGLTQNMGEVFGIALFDALFGTRREDTKSYGVYSLGYRYSINRFRIGGDVSFTSTTSKLGLLNEQTPSLKESRLSFMVLPTFEFQYYKKGLVELYGSAAAGLNLTRTSYKNINGATNYQPQKTTLNPSFAWQVNPITIRVGNNTVGGFLEAGLGHKGFFTAGVSVRF